MDGQEPDYLILTIGDLCVTVNLQNTMFFQSHEARNESTSYLLIKVPLTIKDQEIEALHLRDTSKKVPFLKFFFGFSRQGNKY